MEREIAFGSRHRLDEVVPDALDHRLLDKRQDNQEFDHHRRMNHVICGLEIHLRGGCNVRAGLFMLMLLPGGLGPGPAWTAMAAGLVARIHFAGFALVVLAPGAGVLMGAEVPTATVHVVERL